METAKSPKARLLLLFSATLVSAVLFVGASPAEAQSDKLKEAREGVRAAIETLEQAGNLSAEEQLDFRKEGLRKIFVFYSTEAGDLRERILAARPRSLDYLPLEQLLVVRLDEHVKYIAAQEKILKNLGAVDAVRFLAAQFDTWHSSEYQKTAAEAVDFLLVLRGEALLGTADARFSKIAGELPKFRGVKFSDWQPHLFGAARAIREARDLHLRARADLLKRLISREPEETKESGDEEKPEQVLSADEELLVPAPSIRDLVIASVEKMKEAYRSFLTIAQLLRP